MAAKGARPDVDKPRGVSGEIELSPAKGKNGRKTGGTSSQIPVPKGVRPVRAGAQPHPKKGK